MWFKRNDTIDDNSGSVPRFSMVLWAVICLAMAVIYGVFSSTKEFAMIAMTVFMFVLSVMFGVLAMSPKNNPNLLGRKSGIKKSTFAIICVVLAFVLFGVVNSITGGPMALNPPSYAQITQAEAKAIIDSDEECIILDVRTEEEFATGYIEGAVLIPDFEISERAEAELPDKNMQILVYCRSGSRSKAAAETLASLGYTNVKEFGGLETWEYGITTPTE